MTLPIPSCRFANPRMRVAGGQGASAQQRKQCSYELLFSDHPEYAQRMMSGCSAILSPFRFPARPQPMS